jgi:hypothetical protein
MDLVFIVNSEPPARASVPSPPVETHGVLAPNGNMIPDSCRLRGEELTAEGSSIESMSLRSPKKCLKAVSVEQTRQLLLQRGCVHHQNVWTAKCLLGMEWAF